MIFKIIHLMSQASDALHADPDIYPRVVLNVAVPLRCAAKSAQTVDCIAFGRDCIIDRSLTDEAAFASHVFDDHDFSGKCLSGEKWPVASAEDEDDPAI